MIMRVPLFIALASLALCAPPPPPGDGPAGGDAPADHLADPNGEPPAPDDVGEKPEGGPQELPDVLDGLVLDSPPYDMAVVEDIDCDSVGEWDDSIFEGSAEEDGVGSLEAKKVKAGSFLDKAGFSRYTRVFGIPIVGSDNIGSVTLGKAARTLASLLDNDGDGKADNPLWIEGLLRYRVIFGYFPSGAASEQFWKNADKRSSYKPFMEQYLCNMHFVEIWQADLSTLYYSSMKERAALVENGTLEPDSPNILKRCGTATTDKFDLSLWYYLFSIYYYGIVDHLSPENALKAEQAMRYIQDSRGFNPHYAADPEMTLADFLAWATLTNMGALQCHCTQTAVQNHWRPCRKDDLPPPLVELLNELPNLPSSIPNPDYPEDIPVELSGEFIDEPAPEQPSDLNSQ